MCRWLWTCLQILEWWLGWVCTVSLFSSSVHFLKLTPRLCFVYFAVAKRKNFTMNGNPSLSNHEYAPQMLILSFFFLANELGKSNRFEQQFERPVWNIFHGICPWMSWTLKIKDKVGVNWVTKRKLGRMKFSHREMSFQFFFNKDFKGISKLYTMLLLV